MNKSRIRILVVEDDIGVALVVKTCLESAGHEVIAIAPTAERAIEEFEDRQPDLVLMDIMLKSDLDGIEAARVIRSRSNVPIVFVASYGDEDTIKRAEGTHPSGFIIKPFRGNMLLETAETAYANHLKRERANALR
ncbi:MAG: response regulator [Nitrospinae bacterium]|nr:response regulator [Nitrospinota bacterium]